jgi:hypothetical protein
LYSFGAFIHYQGRTIAGFDNGDLVYSKNTSEKVLSSSIAYYGNANGIAVNDTDVYVAGYVAGAAVYWKNGTEIKLEPGAANAIAVPGTDGYVTGDAYSSSSITTAAFWKNGARTSLVSSQPGTLEKEVGNAVVVVNH